VRLLLLRLSRRGIPAGLVTGNLSRIAWKKMEHAGLRHYFRFGVFAEVAHSRAALVKLALGRARREGWIDHKSRVSLIGDHPNDILAARANRIRAVAVATGLSTSDELATHGPDILVPDLRSLNLESLIA
jgi:phosphoglycolate phosphatase-like HAD superfamily hydrolase